MRIFARHGLTGAAVASDDELLLEGSWPSAQRRAGRWSLDEAIDGGFAWIDRLAIEYAGRAASPASGKQAVNFPYLNALSLRYYFVKLLRPLAFFRDVRPLMPGDRIDLHLAAKRDEHYADLFQELADQRGATLIVHWHESTPCQQMPALRPLSWRRWAAGARRWSLPSAVEADGEAPRVVLCGSPRILNSVCAELVARGCRVWWLYERFAVRCWWRWRGSGVEQLVCEDKLAARRSFNDVAAESDLCFDGIRLARPVERWLADRAAEIGPRQSLLIERVENHFREVRPTALVLDEDATPLKRTAAALARGQGARSTVVQHGAPCGPFGFMPLAADTICVWGQSSRRQLEAWGMPAERIRVTGWPGVKRQILSLEPVPRVCAPRAKRFLLLATVPPRDERPDNVEFHLTAENYADLFALVQRVLSRIDGAALTIKLHPRASRRTACIPFQPIGSGNAGTNDRNEFRSTLPVRVVRSHDLPTLLAASDCVLSCASTAGIEAALAGAPVVQLLPAGSGDVLRAEEWGFVGAARTAEELSVLVSTALARGWQKNQPSIANVLAEEGRAAAARVVDELIGRRDDNGPGTAAIYEKRRVERVERIPP